MDDLIVWLHGRRVGALRRSHGSGIEFFYDDAYRDDPLATPLSLSLPPGTHVHRGDRVAAYLWGLMPDDPSVTARWARSFGCSATDVFGLLHHVGGDVAGAAVYLPDGEDPSRTGGSTPVGESDVAEMLADARTGRRARFIGRTEGRWSLAGTQAKIALAFDGADRWSMPSGSAATTHILKPAIDGLDDQYLDEVICLRAARKLGLPAIEVDIGHFANERAVVAKRYDRTGAGPGARRIHQEDFCQALGIHPTHKYESDGGPGTADLFSVVRSHSAAPAADAGRIGDALAFNWLVLGTDAHAKNYSLVLDGPRVRVAPLYDIASIAPYNDGGHKVKLAQKIGGEYRATRILSRHWERVATEAGLARDAYLGRIADLGEQLPDALHDAAAELDLTTGERRAAAAIIDSIVDWSTSRSTTIDRPPARSKPPAASKPRPVQGRAPKGSARGGQFLPIERPASSVEATDDGPTIRDPDDG